MRTRHVPPRARPWFRTTAWLALVLLLQQPAAALAQATDAGQRLKGGDQIVLIVPSRPDLDQSLTLDAGGRVSIPQVGEVALAGLTVAEAQEILRQRLRVFYPKVTAVEVDLQSASQMRLYVIGEVRSSGHYDFAVPPGAWDLLRAAGGPSEGADLSRARVVRVEDGQAVVIEVDLSGVLDGRGAPDVVLRNGDTLVVPSAAAGGVTVLAHAGVQVFGAVATPTVVPLSEPTELLQVLMLAGAPLTDSNLRKVYWVHRGPDGFRSNRVDVRRFLEQGDPLGNPAVYPGDTIEVATYRESWAARNLPLLLGMLATTATVVLAYDSLAND
ncbi:MAG: polysaccharide biosynthesis/export family protein [Krumholzibacteria bacterium]|nr:polysaccharide biosynthesis/export family protein [Candidatus Krumholzibacteria bacterium]